MTDSNRGSRFSLNDHPAFRMLRRSGPSEPRKRPKARRDAPAEARGPRIPLTRVLRPRALWAGARMAAGEAQRRTANAAADSLGSLLTLAVDDWNVRAVLVTGNRVRAWASAGLPDGVVGDGTVLDSRALATTIDELVESLYRGADIRGRDVALSIGGRTHLLARFNVAAEHKSALPAAVRDAIQERFSIEPDELYLDWHASRLEPPAPEEDEFILEPEGEAPEQQYEAYATGMYRNVVESNLKVIRNLDAWPVDARPRPLALAAAANAGEAIILDLEPHNFAVIVLKNGLPEIVREMWVEPDAPAEQLASVAAQQVSTTVRYYDSINPESHFAADSPIFLTGSLAAPGPLVDQVLSQVSYTPADLPQALKASPEFPFTEYAANVGLAVKAGKRPWQRPRLKRVKAPVFHFIPPEFPRRPRPIRSVSFGMAAAVLILAFGLAVREVGEVRNTAAQKAALADEFDRRVAQRTSDLRSISVLQSQITRSRDEAAGLFDETSRIALVDMGFARTLSEVTGLLPPGVLIRELEDDGALVTASFSSTTTAGLLEMARALESSPEFQSVSIRSLARGERNTANRPPSAIGVPGVQGLPDLTSLLGGLGGAGLETLEIPEFPEAPGIPALPGDPVQADPGLANYFTMSVHLARTATGQSPANEGATVSVPRP